MRKVTFRSAEFFCKVFTPVVEVSEEGTALCLQLARWGGVKTGPGQEGVQSKRA